MLLASGISRHGSPDDRMSCCWENSPGLPLVAESLQTPSLQNPQQLMLEIESAYTSRFGPGAVPSTPARRRLCRAACE